MGGRLFMGLLLVLGTLTGLSAHPHVFVEARSKLVFDDAGEAVAVRHIFRFDDAFTAFAIQGFDKNNDGIYSREELSELAKVNIESMADFGYFTFGDNTRIELDFKAPTDYWLEVANVPLENYWAMKPEDFEAMQEDIEMNGGSMPEDVDLLELHFTLPLKDASDAAHPITLDVYDPTYYVDFRFGAEEEAVGTVNAPSACQVTRREPPPLDDATAYALAQIGADQRDLPPELQSAASSQINQMIVTCGDAAAAPAGTVPPATAAEAIAAATSDPEAAGPSAAEQKRAEEVTAAVQQDVAVIDGAAPPAVRTGFLDGIFGTIAVKQKEFYQALVASLRTFRNNPNAAWLLMGLSFAYGIFHAAGPGHGKAIITSYVVANNETLRKGIVLSFASAFAQALTAIVLVGGLAVVFNLTSIAIQDTARWFEIGSYVLITGLGGWLLWQKAVRPLAAGLLARSAENELALAGAGHGHPHHHDHMHHHHGHHHHGHHHDHEIGPDGVCSTCGHAHAPTPDMLTGRITIARAASIILAVGLRPCTGALVVLVFALSQGMIAAGIASTLAMAVGTGITVSLLAGLAVGAKDLAVRLFGEGSPTAVRIHRSIEIVGAAVVFLLGLTLLIATVGWG
ncbi:HoxN/HupN/NixA family nickel/cobalt transporter [Roseibium sp. Sym1]|uniref:HoxN/HupN/NixA family nickel/cobalt transporter n=1 Tax=Roseibium sp. Sym1 TaxID=3016006 RepID=UPI003FA7B571